MILIISDRKDVQAYFVMLELDALGVAHGLFNVADFPTKAVVSQRVGDGTSLCSLALDGGSVVQSSDVQAVWLRKPDLPRLDPAISEWEREFTFNECRAGLRGLYDALGHAYWVSPLDRIRAASNKLRQLREASRLGMPIPKTVFTNDANVAADFIASIDGPVIFKSIGDRSLSTRAGPWEDRAVVGELFTTLLDSETIEAGLSRLSRCPALFQEYVEKDVELRITVVGSQVFTAELHSQAHPETAIDWKRADAYTIEHRVHELPASVEGQCVRLVGGFGLEFGAIDMVKTKDGRYVFLEINPNGQYGWIEDLTGLGISKAIAARLASRARGRRPPPTRA